MADRRPNRGIDDLTGGTDQPDQSSQKPERRSGDRPAHGLSPSRPRGSSLPPREDTPSKKGVLGDHLNNNVRPRDLKRSGPAPVLGSFDPETGSVPYKLQDPSGEPGPTANAMEGGNRPGVDTNAIGDPLPESRSSQDTDPNSDGSDRNTSNRSTQNNDGDQNQLDTSGSGSAAKKSGGSSGSSSKSESLEESSKTTAKASSGSGAAAAGGEAAEAAQAAKVAATTARTGVILANPVTWAVVGIAIVLMLIVGLLFVVTTTGMAGTRQGGGPAQQGGGTTAGAADCGKLSGTPKEIVDKVALPIAHEIAFKDVTAETVEAANAAHSTSTASGNLSDHKGPPERAWAADISNGTAPTPEMDQLSKDLAKCFGFPPEQWQGDCHSTTKDGYRIQLIYRTQCGGNHDNHVHIGVAKV